jgi:hypothetical protein
MTNKSKLIKDVLVKLASNDQLPADMNTLDEHIFDDVIKMDIKYLEHHAEQHALGQYLSEYPEDMEYEDIIERLVTNNLVNEESHIVIWEPFEEGDPARVAVHIENAKSATLTLLKEVFEGWMNNSKALL